jgi:hypothetical protein
LFAKYCQKGLQSGLFSKALKTKRGPSKNEPGLTGLEPATSAVTGRCSHQLNYNPKFDFFQKKSISQKAIYVALRKKKELPEKQTK